MVEKESGIRVSAQQESTLTDLGIGFGCILETVDLGEFEGVGETGLGSAEGGGTLGGEARGEREGGEGVREVL